MSMETEIGQAVATPERDEILRGFEIVRLTITGWERVAAFRPTELAARQAAADVNWLRWRHPQEKYDLRALVSVRREAK